MFNRFWKRSTYCQELLELAGGATSCRECEGVADTVFRIGVMKQEAANSK